MSSAAATRSRAPRFGIGPQVVAILLVLGLVGAMAIQPTRQLLAQRDRIEGMASDLHSLERVNADLQDRIGRLQDPDYIEQRAREIGLVKAGETPFVVMPPSRSRTGRRAKQPVAVPVEPPERGAIEGFLYFLGVI
ncbi:MAG: septum formation initiator family protein [Actinomycetota bacterium]|nr:septum formation initiator family protein [Actinomycetota bacterium]